MRGSLVHIPSLILLFNFLSLPLLGLLDGDAATRGDISISDPVCDQFWHSTWRRISTRNTEIYDEVFKCIPTDFVKTFASLRKHQEEPPLSKSDPELAAKRAMEIQVTV